MSNQKITNQSIKRIPLAEMVAQSGYQRPTNPKQVKNIIAKFDESQLGIITVSYRDGKYHIIDGAHRSHAMRNLGYTHAIAIVITGLAYEEEAELFSRQNDGKRMLKPYDLFKSGLEAGDIIAVNINEIVKGNGFQVGSSGRKNYYRITAIKALYAIALEYSFATLDNTLCLIASTWAGLTKATQGECLLGVAEFVHRYGMVAFTDRLREKLMVVWYYYEEEKRSCGVAAASTSARKRFCRILVEQYNAGLPARSKKRLVWEN